MVEIFLASVAVVRRLSANTRPSSEIVVLKEPKSGKTQPEVVAPAPVVTQVSPVPAKPSVPEVAPEAISAPAIANPEVAKLVNEARAARVAEDMGTAVAKLEQAKLLDAEEPNVLYELGLVHETMGVYDVASKYYEQLFRLGAAKAGAYYELAARKLRDGVQEPTQMRGKLALGRVRIFRDPNLEQGQRVVLTIPVQNAPGNVVTADDFVVTVKFFDQVRGQEIVPASEQAQTSYQWTTGKLDWAGGQEELRVTYVIPPQSEEQQQLFGERRYYGQVVELTYKNELIDLDAWPRDLAARSVAPQKNSENVPEFQEKDNLPPDFNPDLPLLPGQ